MRATLTIFIVLLGLVIVVATYLGGRGGAGAPTAAPPAAVSEAPAPPPAPTSPTGGEPSASSAPEAPASQEPPAPRAPAVEAQVAKAEVGLLRARGVDQAKIAMIGSRDPADGYDLYVELSAWGASILRIDVTDYKKHVDDPDPYTLMTWAEDPSAPEGRNYVFAFAATAVTINGQRVSLNDQRWELVEPTDPAVWRTTFAADPAASPGAPTPRAVYELMIEDESGREVALLRRTYEMGPDSHDLRVGQTIENRMGGSLEVIWEQDAQASPVKDDSAYMGDRRMLMAGYFNLSDDPRKTNIYVDGATIWHTDAAGKGLRVYPNSSLPAKSELVWAAMVNRYFALAVHPVLPNEGTLSRQSIPTLDAQWARLGQRVVGRYDSKHDTSTVLLTLSSREVKIPPGGRGELPVSLYAGPRLKAEFAKTPYAVMDFSQLIRYELGCAFCTFQPLARALLWFLTVIHAAVGDWGIAILVLVGVVRLILHPITKKSQVNMMKMGKQMQALQPEIEKLKKRYPDDPKKMQEEQMKLFREKGINPANFLGCLPMFLQTPIWIALYAMLYFAIELFQQPAFYGVFQLFGGWQFLADLSQPDRFIQFLPEPRSISLLFMPLEYSSLNVLPLLWGVTMVAQQHFMTPPATNEQMAQQQKIMKWIMLLFPIMLYSAPSGLMLYILASTCAGILDSYLVRKHIKELEARGELFAEKKAKEPKPGGLIDRMQKAVAERQKQMEKLQDKRRPGERAAERRRP